VLIHRRRAFQGGATRQLAAMLARWPGKPGRFRIQGRHILLPIATGLRLAAPAYVPVWSRFTIVRLARREGD